MLFGERQPKAFGVDISETSIKVMQLESRRGQLVPTAFSRVELPPILIANHMIADEGKLADFLVKALRSAKGLNGHHVVVNVPEAKSFVRTLKMPKMDEKELAGAIPWELEQDIPVPIDLVYMDWEVAKEDADNIQVLVTATPKDYVDALIRACKMAKLRPVALELESRAAARALMRKQEGTGSVIIVDISSSGTSFVIVSPGGNIEYTSSIPIGSANITDNISKALGIPPKEAEKIKRESGLLTDSKKGNLQQAIIGVLDATIDEIRNVIRYHEDHSQLGAKIDTVILTGGGSALLGVADYFSARMNVSSGRAIDRVILGDPYASLVEGAIGLIPTEDALSYTTAIGLALRSHL